MKLPENKPQIKDNTPKVFFIYGESMTGKTYLARQFKNPLLINTDGNCKKTETPSVFVQTYKELIEVLAEVEKGNHSYETIIIDLVDDMETMLVNLICEAQKDEKVESLADIGFGKGYAMFLSRWKNLMLKVSQMPYYIVFISHAVSITENNITSTKPTLGTRAANACMGRCDLVLETKKIGNNYFQYVRNRRDKYRKEDIQDSHILELLENVYGLFDEGDDTLPTPKKKKKKVAPMEEVEEVPEETKKVKGGKKTVKDLVEEVESNGLLGEDLI